MLKIVQMWDSKLSYLVTTFYYSWALCSEMVICYSAESFQKLSEIVIMFFIVEIRKPKLGEFEEIVQS